jgi:hypothetical protein
MTFFGPITSVRRPLRIWLTKLRIPVERYNRPISLGETLLTINRYTPRKGKVAEKPTELIVLMLNRVQNIEGTPKKFPFSFVLF